MKPHTLTQWLDLMIRVATLVVFAWASIHAVVRWIRRGRVESYSLLNLLPGWLGRYLMGGDAARGRAGVTVWGWIFAGVIVVWVVLGRLR